MSTTTVFEPTSPALIYLKPRPYASRAGFLILVPLLPQPKQSKILPSEIWSEVFDFVALDEERREQIWTISRVSKAFNATALPIAFKRVQIRSLRQLEIFYQRLSSAEQKWDSIRRIPYSAPGRWVQALDLTQVKYADQAQAFQLDSILTSLFILIPFLNHLTMNPEFVMSRRAIISLSQSPGVVNIRSLVGITYTPAQYYGEEESIVSLLRCCHNLEELEIRGHSLDPFDHWTAFEGTLVSQGPLTLPHLRVLTLLSIHSSPLLHTLLVSHLPSLEKLTITPYNDVPESPVSQFIETHGARLRSLLLLTPKSWPTRLHPSPDTLFQTSPKLRHLSVEQPLPALRLEDAHPLQFLSIPRPTVESWDFLARLLPYLPNLCAVRARDVKRLRNGMNARAQTTGVQGTMREWQKRLARRGVRMLDTEWKDVDAI